MKLSIVNKISLISSVVLCTIFCFPDIALAGTKTIGEACANNSECQSGDCETSSKKDGNGTSLSYCDCDDLSLTESADCANNYPAKPGPTGSWGCVDGTPTTYDLDFCLWERDDGVVSGVADVELPQGANPAVTSTADMLASLFTSRANQVKLMDQVKTLVPQLSIKIPGLEFSGVGKNLETTPNGDVYMYVPFIGQLLKALYNFGLIAASILGVIIIIMAGVQIIMSGGGEGKITGYKKIGKVIVGMMIAWGSYTILYIINPSLVKFSSIKIQYVASEEAQFEKAIIIKGTDTDAASTPSNAPPSAGSVNASCPSEDNLVSLKGVVPLGGGASSNGRVLADIIEPLKKANEIAKTHNREILVLSAVRTLEKQTQLWNDGLKKYGTPELTRKKVAFPDPACKAPHMTGRAVDVCLKGSPTCGQLDGDLWNLTGPDITLLQKIMKEAGFLRYCGEWWHFEYKLNMSGRCSP